MVLQLLLIKFKRYSHQNTNETKKVTFITLFKQLFAKTDTPYHQNTTNLKKLYFSSHH